MATFSEVPLFSSGRGVGLMAFFAICEFVVFGGPNVLAAWSSFRKAHVSGAEHVYTDYRWRSGGVCMRVLQSWTCTDHV